jgi:hypothetical protein
MAGCFNPFDSPQKEPSPDIPAGGLVSIRIGGDGNARTVQPVLENPAYRLTFSDGPAHDPVDIESGNEADVYLVDGTYTITATAYRAGGTIGNIADAAAEGSISVTLSDGVVTSDGGNVPPIILGPAGAVNGTLQYTITKDEAVTGNMKLWEINGTTPISDFGTSGELSIEDGTEVSDTYELEPGRYIAEIRLEDGNGDIAFYREVVEIWAGTNTAIAFEPDLSLDSTAILANSGAALSPASTIGGVAIGTGTGSGEDETSAIFYALGVLDIADAPLGFVLENDSLYADISWTATTGSPPGGAGYNTTAVSDFSNNNTLWVKVVSEDQSTTRYYEFAMTEARGLTVLQGSGYTYAKIDGLKTLTITGSGPNTIGMTSGFTLTTKDRIVVNPGVNANITLSDVNIDMSGIVGTAAFDMTGATVTLTLEGSNVLKSGRDKAGLEAPSGAVLTITAADSSHSLDATGGGYSAGIGGGRDKTGGTITINGGTVIATGSSYDNGSISGAAYSGAGIGGGGSPRRGVYDTESGDGGEGGTITITGGTVTATGGSGSFGGAGIGGGGAGGTEDDNGKGGGGGAVTISGGTVTATSGNNGAGIGGSSQGNGGTVTISGGTVTATAGYRGAGIGGGDRGLTGGIISISGGTVTATISSEYGTGAGIGGGHLCNGGTISISGGTIISTGYIGIGSGYHGAGGTISISGGMVTTTAIGGDTSPGTITALSGNAVVFATLIVPTLSNATQAIVFSYNAGTMYGNVTLQQDVTIPSDKTLALASGQTLTIPETVTLTNEGIIKKNGGTIVGTVGGGGTVNP